MLLHVQKIIIHGGLSRRTSKSNDFNRNFDRQPGPNLDTSVTQQGPIGLTLEKYLVLGNAEK